MADLYKGLPVNCSSLNAPEIKACEDEIAKRLENGECSSALTPVGPGTGWTAYSRAARPVVARPSVGIGGGLAPASFLSLFKEAVKEADEPISAQ